MEETMSGEVAVMATKTKSCSGIAKKIVGRCVSRLAVALVLAAVILVAASVGYAAAVGISPAPDNGAWNEGTTLPPGHPDVTLPPGHPDVQLLPPGHPPIDAIPGQPRQDPSTGGPVYEL